MTAKCESNRQQATSNKRQATSRDKHLAYAARLRHSRGELPQCDEPGGSLTGRAVMADLFADFPGPVLIGFPSGHTTGPAFTLPLGVSCRVIAGARPRLVIDEAAVD